MIGLAIVLIALGLGDLVAGGLTGEPASPRRATAGLVVGVAVGLIGSWWAGLRGLALVAAVLIAGLGVAGWLLGKGFGRPATVWHRPRLTLGWLVATVLVTLALAPLWPAGLRPGFENWVSALPFAFVEHLGATRLLTMIGVMLFLSAPANAFVRGSLDDRRNRMAPVAGAAAWRPPHRCSGALA